MSSASRHLRIRPTAEQRVELGGLAYYVGHFRGFAADAHAHGCLRLLVPLQGRMHVRAGAHDALLGPEWGLVLMPGVHHAFTHLDGEVSVFAIDGPAELLERWTSGAEAPAAGFWVVRDARLWLVASQMALELEEAQPGRERVLETSLDLLGLYLRRALAKPSSAGPARDPRVLRAVDKLLRDYAEELSVEELAAEVAMSNRHFERCFKAVVGHAPRQFLIEVRIGAARELLAETAMPVTAIALEVGFKTASHFAETFLRVVGMTPSAYRTAQRKGR